jgi:hypothetical protein
MDDAEETLLLQSSVLTPTGKGTVVTDSQPLNRADLRQHLERVEMTSFDNARIEDFGTTLLDGQPISGALLEGRKAVRDLDSVDWADYIHYGNPHFQLKR